MRQDRAHISSPLTARLYRLPIPPCLSPPTLMRGSMSSPMEQKPSESSPLCSTSGGGRRGAGIASERAGQGGGLVAGAGAWEAGKAAGTAGQGG